VTIFVLFKKEQNQKIKILIDFTEKLCLRFQNYSQKEYAVVPELINSLFQNLWPSLNLPLSEEKQRQSIEQFKENIEALANTNKEKIIDQTKVFVTEATPFSEEEVRELLSIEDLHELINNVQKSINNGTNGLTFKLILMSCMTFNFALFIHFFYFVFQNN
jgi:hypothetical protein